MLALGRDEFTRDDPRGDSSQTRSVNKRSLVGRLSKFSLLIFSAFISHGAQSAALKPASKEPVPLKTFLEKKLRREKFDSRFIQKLLQDYETKDFHSVLELNVLLFLRKSNYHGPQISDSSVLEVEDFKAIHASTLEQAEIRYGVDASTVASLLWIESRLGKNRGDFHVPSVYLHLVQAPRVSVQNYLFSRTAKFADSETEVDKREIVRRTHKKSKWAIEELRALSRVHKWKWKIGTDLRGSFSGAFGIPQFLPSSYIRWGRAFDKTRQPLLDDPRDAIMSVAYYLKDHGWKKKNRKSQLEALYMYNNSRDYAEAIADLADRVDK